MRENTFKNVQVKQILFLYGVCGLDGVTNSVLYEFFAFSASGAKRWTCSEVGHNKESHSSLYNNVKS